MTRQAYYKRKLFSDSEDLAREALENALLAYVHYVRQSHNLPKSGYRELWSLCQEQFKEALTIGRDRFRELLRANGLMQRKRRFRPRTTDSRHHLKCYPDLVNTEPKRIATRPGELLVADITYIPCRSGNGFAFLSLLTDAATRCIVGYHLHPTLETDGPLIALDKAINFYKSNGIDTSQLIHHSDRGSQYASHGYVARLREAGFQISMTQTGDPLHNALAERMNGLLKNSWSLSNAQQSFAEAEERVARAVQMYNEARPHQAIGGKTPLQAFGFNAPNPLVRPLLELPLPAPELTKKSHSSRRRIFVR